MRRTGQCIGRSVRGDARWTCIPRPGIGGGLSGLAGDDTIYARAGNDKLDTRNSTPFPPIDDRALGGSGTDECEIDANDEATSCEIFAPWSL